MDPEYLSMLVDLHKRQARQGPGSETTTNQAIAMAALQSVQPLRIADIGCGTGASTLQLASALNAEITAVDFLPDFIAILEDNAAKAGLRDNIETLLCSMEDLPFEDAEFDLIWSEGAIYNMGFKKGVNAWKRFLKPGGRLVVSEITWTTDTRPEDIHQHWDSIYPEIDTAAAKIKILEEAGYSAITHFILPESCWMENYYQPLQNQFPEFLQRHAGKELAVSIVEDEKKEIALYEKYKDFYSYGMYIAQV